MIQTDVSSIEALRVRIVERVKAGIDAKLHVELQGTDLVFKAGGDLTYGFDLTSSRATPDRIVEMVADQMLSSMLSSE